jgi:general nucleoside transport system permease protein
MLGSAAELSKIFRATSGRGFIGLGATAGASFLFGVFGALGDRLQTFRAPPQFALMAPSLSAIVGLVFARLRLVWRNWPARIEREKRHEPFDRS